MVLSYFEGISKKNSKSLEKLEDQIKQLTGSFINPALNLAQERRWSVHRITYDINDQNAQHWANDEEDI